MRRTLFPKERFPNGHPELAKSINHLGALHWAAGEYARAEPFLREALVICSALYPKERFPSGHPDLAASINNLAALHYPAGEYAKISLGAVLPNEGVSSVAVGDIKETKRIDDRSVGPSPKCSGIVQDSNPEPA